MFKELIDFLNRELENVDDVEGVKERMILESDVEEGW